MIVGILLQQWKITARRSLCGIVDEMKKVIANLINVWLMLLFCCGSNGVY